MKPVIRGQGVDDLSDPSWIHPWIRLTQGGIYIVTHSGENEKCGHQLSIETFTFYHILLKSSHFGTAATYCFCWNVSITFLDGIFCYGKIPTKNIFCVQSASSAMS